MNTSHNTMQVAGIDAHILRKPVKNLHLNVLPPAGAVRVTAPLGMSDEAIHLFLATRIVWIKKQQSRFQAQERQAPREYVSGETIYYLGNKYRFELIYKNITPTVNIVGKSKILLTVRPNSDTNKREEILFAWCRRELRTILFELIKKHEEQIGVKVNSWGIKRMKTRWGTCNHKSKSIWLNLELIKKPLSCIEYVVVHELLHLVEEKHNEKFITLMNKYLPKWQNEKEVLNQLILPHEEWKKL